MSLSSRIRANQGGIAECVAMSGDDRCTRPDPHGPEDRHQRGAHTWGGRNVPPRPRWLENIKARELSGYGPL